ncbi:MAG TPA: glucose 1-dehydrogenase [Gammaproteobacteria bacterium]|jgi:NAD(P)-dependent dehydrogenase (short-subunit alcohol dehydrogenase family)
MNIDLQGKRALVTGANSGIGRAIALAMSRAGAVVGINYIAQQDAADDVVHEIEAAGGRAIRLEADISDPEAVRAMFAEFDSSFRGVDILVNNAGTDGARALSWEADPQAWRKVLEVNLFGAFHCAQEALKRMVPQGHGVVINITSVHERIPWSGYSAYTASKAALSMLTKTLAQEAAPHGVRVLALAPGAIKTPINSDVWDKAAGLADLIDKIPEGRLGKPEDIADMAVLMASDLASYVTGTSVFIDGGMTLYPSFSHGG